MYVYARGIVGKQGNGGCIVSKKVSFCQEELSKKNAVIVRCTNELAMLQVCL
jgi:hypothetical protein